MSRKKIEVLEVPVLSSHVAALKVIAERRGISIERLALEFISIGLKLERRLGSIPSRKSSRQFAPDLTEKPRIRELDQSKNKSDLLLQCIGMQIKRRRLELGMSQFDLGWKSGFSRTLILDVESGKRAVGHDKVERIAAALNIDGSQLLHLAERISNGAFIASEVNLSAQE